MSSKRYIKPLIIFSILCFFSCNEYEVLEIEKDARRIADSTFRADRDSLIKFNEAQCQLQFDSIYQIYFDSIKILEGQRIQNLIKK